MYLAKGLGVDTWFGCGDGGGGRNLSHVGHGEGVVVVITMIQRSIIGRWWLRIREMLCFLGIMPGIYTRYL